VARNRSQRYNYRGACVNIVLTGAPGAGKDTLAVKLHDQYGFQILTTGDLYRKEFSLGTDFGIKAHSYWGQGNLCPDDMTNELMSRALVGLEKKENIIFNGYPRTISQAEYLDKLIHIDVNLHLDVEEAIAIERLLRRGRIDDKEDVIRKRFTEYNIKTFPLLEYYSNTHRWHKVLSNRTEQEVLQNAVQIILNKYKL